MSDGSFTLTGNGTNVYYGNYTISLTIVIANNVAQTITSGSITGSLVSTTNITLQPPGVGIYIGNDNLFYPLNPGFSIFTTEGLNFLDVTNNVSNNIYDNFGANVNILNSSGDQIVTITSTCLLYINLNKVLTNKGYVSITELKEGDLIVSEKKVVKINEIVFPVGKVKNLMLINNVYISDCHAIKNENVYVNPYYFGKPKLNEEEIENLENEHGQLRYVHISVERNDGETRRDVPIIVNDLVVESYSNEKL